VTVSGLRYMRQCSANICRPIWRYA